MMPPLPDQVSYTSVAIDLLQSFGLIFLYIFISFGPGLVVGILLANFIFGRGKPTLMDIHEQNKKKAEEHNAQWDPKNPRWRK